MSKVLIDSSNAINPHSYEKPLEGLLVFGDTEYDNISNKKAISKLTKV